jgi:hypothetical protein
VVDLLLLADSSGDVALVLDLLGAELPGARITVASLLGDALDLLRTNTFDVVLAGCPCVAEGVETSEQYATLRALGCHLGQGFLWSPAVPVGRLAEVLAQCADVDVPEPSRFASVPQGPLGAQIVARILALHGSGASLQTIARALNNQSERDPSGLRWTPGAVERHIHQ